MYICVPVTVAENTATIERNTRKVGDHECVQGGSRIPEYVRAGGITYTCRGDHEYRNTCKGDHVCVHGGSLKRAWGITYACMGDHVCVHGGSLMPAGGITYACRGDHEYRNTYMGDHLGVHGGSRMHAGGITSGRITYTCTKMLQYSM